MSDLEHKLSEANGALGDIYTLVTSCIGQFENEELNKTCYYVIKRILSSGSKNHIEPAWFVNNYEKQAWNEYKSNK